MKNRPDAWTRREFIRYGPGTAATKECLTVPKKGAYQKAIARVFISFDFDHDEDLGILLVGQAKTSDSPFQIVDWSDKEPLTGDGEEKIRQRIKNVDQVAVMCGEHTHLATGVSAELTMAQGEDKPYFLLHGRKDKNCTKPRTAKASDKIYNWTWDNLKILIGGAR